MPFAGLPRMNPANSVNPRARHAAAVWPFLPVFRVSSTPFGRSRSGRATLTQFWGRFFFKTPKIAVFQWNSVENVEIAKLSSKVVFSIARVQHSRSFGPSTSFRCGRLAGLIPGDLPEAPRIEFGATLTQFWALDVVSLRPFARSDPGDPPQAPRKPRPPSSSSTTTRRGRTSLRFLYIYKLPIDRQRGSYWSVIIRRITD